jgi:ABC-type dipeptide/oligopeptide/nickel transport system permease component
VPLIPLAVLIAGGVLALAVFAARGRRSMLRHALMTLALLLASAPFAVVVTLVLFPLWTLLESTTGIESVGHSGPAEWCYVITFGIIALISLSLYARRARRGRA